MRRRALAPTLAFASVIALGAAVLVVAATAAHAQVPAPAPGGTRALDGMRETYQSAAPLFRGRLLPMAQRTFLLLATVEFAVTGMLFAIRRESLDEMAGKFLQKFTLLAILLTLITLFTTWIPPLFNGWVFAGETAIGGGAVTPSDVINLGQQATFAVLHALSFTTAWKDPVMALFAALASLIIGLAYVAVAVQMTLAMVEVAIAVLGGGVVFLAMAGSRWTASIAENAIAYVIAVGIRVFLLYLIVGLGAEVARSWIPVIQTSTFTNDGALFQVLGGSVLYAVLAIRIPNTVAARLTSGSSLGIAQALRSLS